MFCSTPPVLTARPPHGDCSLSFPIGRRRHRQSLGDLLFVWFWTRTTRGEEREHTNAMGEPGTKRNNARPRDFPSDRFRRAALLRLRWPWPNHRGQSEPIGAPTFAVPIAEASTAGPSSTLPVIPGPGNAPARVDVCYYPEWRHGQACTRPSGPAIAKTLEQKRPGSQGGPFAQPETTIQTQTHHT